MSGRRRWDDWLDCYFSHGVDNRRRRIFLHDDVTEETIARFVQGMVLLADDTDTTITIYMSSLGGSMHEMFGAFDAIRACRCFVRGIAYGKIMSAALLILRACDEALAYPNVHFMSHEESWGGEYQGHSKQKIDMKYYGQMEQRWAMLMGEYTLLTAENWRKMSETGRDRYFDAEQALKWGVIDGIMHPNEIRLED